MRSSEVGGINLRPLAAITQPRLTFNFCKLEPFTMRLLVRQTLRAAMFAVVMAGFVLSASAAHAHKNKRDGDWHGNDRDWHGDRDWRWRGGIFLGAPAPFYVAPPVPPPAYYHYYVAPPVYNLTPPAYYYSPYGY